MQAVKRFVGNAFVSTILLVALAALGPATKADVISFDAPPSPGSTQLSSATFQGFDFTTPGSFNHVLSGHFSNAVSHNGSSFIILATGAGSAVLMSNAQPFLVQSFDADTFIHIQGTTSITVTGFFTNGGSISQTFVTDAIGDGPGPSTDFQTFSLIGFTDLTSIQFQANDHTLALDNINVLPSAAEVPEPGTMLLFGSGLMVLGGALRKRSKKGV